MIKNKKILNILLGIVILFLILIMYFIVFMSANLNKAVDEKIKKQEIKKKEPIVLEISNASTFPNNIKSEDTTEEATEDNAVMEEKVEDVNTFSTMYTTCSVNIRYGAGTDSKVYKTVKPNTELKVSDNHNVNGWKMISMDDKELYISSKYLSKNKVVIKENTYIEKPVEVSSNKLIGKFKITHYAGHSSTATGTTPTVGRTIAVDPRVIPYGSKVVINGHTYTAEDCGGAIKGNVIDIYVSSRDEAYQKGVYYTNVYWG